MTSTLFIVQIVLAILITIAVLLQKSSSIGLGAYSGSNESVFGAKGPAGFLAKLTFTLGLLFVINTLALGYLYTQENKKSAVDTIKSEIPAPTAKPLVPPTSSTSGEKNSSTTIPQAPATETNSSAKASDSAKNSNTDANVEKNSSTVVMVKESTTNSKATNVSTNETNNANEANNSQVTSSTNEANASEATNKKSSNANAANSISEDKDVELKIANILKEHKIKFETDSAMLTPDSIETLKAIVAILKEHPNLKIEIAGHTDSDGNAEYNKKLSQERVDAVKKALVDFGINGNNLKAVGYGSSKPLVKNDSPENKAKNRRVEFKVIK